MKKKNSPVLSVVLFFSACAGPGAGSPDETAFELALAQQLAFDVTRLNVGDWALYAATVEGKPEVEHYKHAVVAGEGSALWIENKIPCSPQPPMILKSKFDRSGKLLEQWRGGMGTSKPVRLYPPSQTLETPPARRDPNTAKVQSQEASETLTVGGKAYPCTRITTTLTYPDGRTSTMTNWCSEEVPFSLIVGSKSYGGVVRRTFGRVTMELAASGRNEARPELILPDMIK